MFFNGYSCQLDTSVNTSITVSDYTSGNKALQQYGKISIIIVLSILKTLEKGTVILVTSHNSHKSKSVTY